MHVEEQPINDRQRALLAVENLDPIAGMPAAV
jgi:hypothetical protein